MSKSENREAVGADRSTQTGHTSKGADARERILSAAMKVFAQHAFKAASTRMIAREAGVDHPLIHYYFGSKENLFKAVAKEIYETFEEVHPLMFDGLAQMGPRKGLALYLDRLLDYHAAHPETLQVILINMSQIGRLEEIPGHEYILMSFEQVRTTMMKRLGFAQDHAEMQSYINCFYNLTICYLGASGCQAQVLDMEADSEEYQEWVKNTLVSVFAPWLERIIKDLFAGPGANNPA